MAQRYRSSRSGSGRPSSRGGGRSGGRSGGRGGGRGGYAPPAKSASATPTVIAVVVVLGALAAIVAFTSSSGGNDDPSPSRRPAVQPVRPAQPDVPKPPPYPDISASLRDQASALMAQSKDLAKEGEAVFQEAMKAKGAGDDDLWQEKLAEASEYYYEIQELWNELIGQMPSNDHYDEEDVANYHLGRESDIVTKALSRLTDIKKQLRL